MTTMILRYPGVDPAERAEWLALRRKSIGASDAPSILGRGYRTPLQIYCDKLGLTPDEPETPEQRRGRRLEPLALEDYREATGADFETQVFLRHPELPWMTATLDALRPDGRVVEVKTVGPFAAREWGDDGTDEVPDRVIIQVQHQMAVAGADVADVAALFGGERFKVYTVEADRDFAALLVEREREFWECVQRRIPPAPAPDDERALRLLFPGTSGQVALPDRLIPDVDDYVNLGQAVAELSRRRDQLKVNLLAAMGEAESAGPPDGRRLRRAIVEVKEHSVKASSYVRFSVHAPKQEKVIR